MLLSSSKVAQGAMAHGLGEKASPGLAFPGFPLQIYFSIHHHLADITRNVLACPAWRTFNAATIFSMSPGWSPYC